ncbi:hypothetical protein HYQ46_000397 [Verticillium longisporum]|nr:hypothetical protein HYQ46_000397 [Verticillium longisporum]
MRLVIDGLCDLLDTGGRRCAVQAEEKTKHGGQANGENHGDNLLDAAVSESGWRARKAALGNGGVNDVDSAYSLLTM